VEQKALEQRDTTVTVERFNPSEREAIVGLLNALGIRNWSGSAETISGRGNMVLLNNTPDGFNPYELIATIWRINRGWCAARFVIHKPDGTPESFFLTHGEFDKLVIGRQPDTRLPVTTRLGTPDIPCGRAVPVRAPAGSTPVSAEAPCPAAAPAPQPVAASNGSVDKVPEFDAAVKVTRTWEFTARVRASGVTEAIKKIADMVDNGDINVLDDTNIAEGDFKTEVVSLAPATSGAELESDRLDLRSLDDDWDESTYEDEDEDAEDRGSDAVREIVGT